MSSRTTSIRLSDELRKAAQDQAEREERTFNSLVKIAIKEYLSKSESK